MKRLRVSLVMSLIGVIMLGAGISPAHADPPVIPGIPGLPTIPSLPELIDQIVPAPPIPVLPSVVPPIAAIPDDQVQSADLEALRLAVMPSPSGDAFFDAWPMNLANYANGQIIESRDITAVAALFVVIPVERVVQFKFRTNDAHSQPSFGTATLVIPATPWQGQGDRSVVVNNLPIDALGSGCTPGQTLANGLSFQTNATDFVPPTNQLAMLRGYAVLIPDHQGPRMSYGEPFVAGHIVLDSIKAVRNWQPDQFAESKFGMTGYSGGAIATHGAVKLIDSYAPELSGYIVGAALGGVPADFGILAGSMNGNLASGVFMGAAFAIGRERPEILARMNHLAQWVAMSPMKDQCINVFAVAGALLLPIDVAANIVNPLQSDLAREIYRVTKMEGMKSGTPLYIYNGAQEFWIPAEGARNLYQEQCSLGVAAVYRDVIGEHVIAGGLGYPEAMFWLDQRLQGVSAPSEC
jgi:hypothetical protein